MAVFVHGLKTGLLDAIPHIQQSARSGVPFVVTSELWLNYLWRGVVLSTMSGCGRSPQVVVWGHPSRAWAYRPSVLTLCGENQGRT